MAAPSDPPEQPGLLGNPLKWSEADRALFAVALMLPGVTVFLISVVFFDGAGYLSPGLDDAARALMKSFAWAGVACWSMVLAAGLIYRRRKPTSRFLPHLVVQAYSLTSASFVVVLGVFHSAGWILFLGGAVVGFFLFGRRITGLGIASFAAALGMCVWLGYQGVGGNILQASQPPEVGSDAWSTWFARMALFTAIFAAILLTLVAYIVSLLRDREQQLEVLSKTDDLTGVTNRRHFMALITAEFARAERYSTPLAVVMIDLDHFKDVNDEHGHLAGDMVLRGVAEVMRQTVRESDVVARYGGEEFVLLLPSTDLTGATDLAERCRALIADRTFTHRGGALEVTASMGVASYPSVEVRSVDDLLSAADDAMYSAKRDGRDRVRVATAA